MALDKKYYIHTGKDGILKSTNEADMRSLISELKKSQKIAIHFHGGLVNKKSALDSAELQLPVYINAGVHPVFMIWESGLTETIFNNLREINKEAIFGLLVKILLQYTVGKLTDMGGAKASGQILLPGDIEVDNEFKKRKRNELPFGDVEPIANLSELSEAERERFEDELAQDSDFQEEIQAIVDGAQPEAEKKTTTAKGIIASHRRSSKTLMSPDVVDKLVTDTAENKGKGILPTSIELALRAGKILARIIKRHIDKRDHGVYATVVEEVLREFYFANIGAFVWERMKKDTADTFEQVGQKPIRAGWFFIQELAKMVKEGHNPEISLVAHSAGSIFACHFLAHVDWARRQKLLPENFKIKHVIFMAPACDFELFNQMLDMHRQSALFEDFRMFALKDKLEAGYWEVPVLYPCSLPYLVSGLLEKDKTDSAYDWPLVGMQRYYDLKKDGKDVYQQPAVRGVRKFLDGVGLERAVVWSEDDRGPGLTSDAIQHGDFENTKDKKPHIKTMESVMHILQHGW